MRVVYGSDVPAVKVAVPSVVQAEDHTCGAAALLAICRYYGVGPDDEATIVRDSQLTQDGSDPVHLLRAIRKYGLTAEEHRGMTDATLRTTLDAKRPVMLAVQAWGEGHWVVAIGYDARGVLLEDPWLANARGFLGWRALAKRWHDIEGEPPVPLVRYGLAVWASRRSTAARSGAPRSVRSVR
jgi:predicted double-glycine peptidase